MTCKDCLHFDACSDWIPPDELLQAIKPEGCNKFKNKADYAEAKHGHWKKHPLANGVVCCSECGYARDCRAGNSCPECGAKMDGKR